MANITTSLTEVPNLNPYYAYLQDFSTKTNKLIGSPAVVNDPLVTSKLAEGGKQTIELSTTVHLTNNSGGVTENLGTDDTDDLGTVTKMGTKILKTPIMHRNSIYSSADIVEVMGNIALMQQAAAESGEIVVNNRNLSLVSTLQGVIAKLGTSHTNSIFTEDGDNAVAANKISDGAIIETSAAWGDQATPSLLCMHSDVYRDLQELDLIDFQRSSEANIGFGMYLQHGVYVDDDCPKRAGTTTGFVYTVFLLRPGAVGFGMGRAKVPMAAWREEQQGNGEGVEYLAVRDRYSWFPRGMSFTGSPAGTTATNTELATSGNWTQIRTDKQIGITALQVNV